MFEAGNDVLVRAAALPLHAADLTSEFGDDLSRVPPGIAADGRMREALLVASPSLADDLAALAHSSHASVKQTRRVARSVARYLLRMSGRSTPFGEMAGVTLGSFGEGSRGDYRGVRKWVQPDREWLIDVIRALEEQSPAVAGHRVVLNNLVRYLHSRVVVSRIQPDGRRTSQSVRRTPVLDAICTLAVAPIPFEHLLALLAQRFPSAPEGALPAMLRQLVSMRVLLSDVYPALDDSDPLNQAAARHPESALLRRSVSLFEAFASRPVGEGYEQLAALYRDAQSTRAVDVTLVLDADVRLPLAVAREAERAAELLWRMSDPEKQDVLSLRSYHREFLERYSLGELVPVVALLDPETGLGPPAGYKMPAGYRAVPEDRPPSEQRRAVLSRLVTESLLSAQRYVELDDSHVAALSYDAGSPPSSMLLRASVIAASAHQLNAGHFTLAVSPRVDGIAGSAWGRFARPLGAERVLREVVSRAFQHESATPVQLMYAAEHDRGSNILATPILADHYLPIGTFAGPGRRGHISLSDVVVNADEEGFHIFDAATGRELMPFVPHQHRTDFAPNVVRFLVDAPRMGVRHTKAFSWQTLRGAPFLPGLQHGRILLRPPTWYVTGDDVRGDQDQDLKDWMVRLRVPDHVRIVEEDRHISLDLSRHEHRLLLREELGRTGKCTLYENPHQGSSESWMRSADGAYDSELVIPLFTRPKPRRSGIFTAVRSTSPPESGLPGGPWLSARLYLPTEAQSEVLTTAVHPWVRQQADVVDRWFFIRYADEGSNRPHLRLRLHCREDATQAGLLAGFHSWCRQLMEAGFISDVVLAPYFPEAERYGGVKLLPLAEDVFHADSALVLSRLAGKDDLVRVVADMAVLVDTFCAAGGVDSDWILRAHPKNEQRHRLFRERRRELMEAVSGARAEPEGQLRAAWVESLKTYAMAVHEAAQELPWVDPGRILGALAHMHCNRRLRLGADEERTVYAMLRGVVQAVVDRAQAAR
jgi:mRNA interferase HicA